MPIWIDFLASIIEILSICGLLAVLDASNRLSLKGLAVVVFFQSIVTIAMDQLQVSFHVVVLLLVYVISMKLLLGTKILHSMMDITIAYGCYVGAQIVTSIVLFKFVGDITQNYALLFGFLLLYLLIPWLFLYWKTPVTALQQCYSKNREIIFVVALNLSIVAIMTIYIWRKYQTAFWEIRSTLLILLLLNYLLIAAAFIVIYQKKQQRIKLEVYQQYGREMDAMMQELASQRHEYTNQLNVIAGLLECSQGDYKQECLAYIETAIHGKTENFVKAVLCEDYVLAAMLYRKQREAEQMGIQFQHMIEKPLPVYPIPFYDLLEVIINLLNNAFEAVEQLEGQPREVFLKIGHKKIEILNSVASDFDMTSLSGYGVSRNSTKGEGRGYGSMNVKKIIKAAGGTLRIVVRDEILVFTISF